MPRMQIISPTCSDLRKVVFGGLLLFTFVLPTLTLAAEKPTKDLEKAVKSGKKVILFEGKESEDFTIRKGVTVNGTNPGKAIISGDIKLENGVTLSNLTVSGKEIPITIARGASVTLINVTIRGGKDAGIMALGGGGTLTLKNSRIINNRKGLYVLDGKNLALSGNVIGSNKEEGLDVRIGTTGTISGNQFIDNGEGGAEIIAGSARLIIQNNTFARNKSSGLSLQSYSGAGKAPGSVKLSKNTFADNRGSGLSCGSPSRGGADGSFYRRTISTTDNIFRGNGEGSIHPDCGGVANQISPKDDVDQLEEEKKREAEALKLREEEELRNRFEIALQELHRTEHALELRIHRFGESTFVERFWYTLFAPSEKEGIEADFETVNMLRESVAQLEITENPILEENRQAVIRESLRRKTELEQAFDRMKVQFIPKSPFVLLF